MGGQICKSIPNDTLANHQYFQLSQKIQIYLKDKKPFQTHIKYSQKKLLKYSQGQYIGPLNLLNKPSGYGKMYKTDGSLYIGSFQNGQAEGQGVYLSPDGQSFQGIFKNNKFLNGTYKNKNFTYTGEFKQNFFNGKGQQKDLELFYQFQGEYKNGKKIKGKMKWKKDNEIYSYEGNFNQNQEFENGGKLTQKASGYYVGEYKNNLKHGKGTYFYNNGLKYIGDYLNGNREGQGILYNFDQSISYEGNFKNGLPHGLGKAKNKQGLIRQSKWIQGIDQSIIA